MSERGRSVKRFFHAAALAFTAWWLVATSAPTMPARECFTGIGATARLSVTLGAALDPPGGAGGLPSCAEVDGVRAGTNVIFDVARGERPVTTGDLCWPYETKAIQGVENLTIVPLSHSYLANPGFSAASGAFATPSGCRGSWFLTLAPEVSPPDGALLSPLDAGADQRWRISRSMAIPQAQFCDGFFTTVGELSCGDSFTVTGITELPAP